MSQVSGAVTRRGFLSLSAAAGVTLAGGAGAAALGSITERYPESRFRSLDPRFGGMTIGNTPIVRIASGNLWAEGPAWSGTGRYLIWSDIPADTQRRWLDDDGHVSVLRQPCGKSNGNTFDANGRQVSCLHLHRRVVRYEADGSETVLADRYDGKPFNGPNDVVALADGSVWFTDPGYGLNWYEGQPGELELKESVYRIDPNGRVERVTDEIYKPNGLCFSPDYKTLYVAETGSSHYPDAAREIRAWDVSGKRLSKGRSFASMEMDDGQSGVADGLRADGLSTLLGGIFNTFPYTAFAQNVGLVSLTRVKSRYVVTVAGGILVLLGLIPKVGAIVEGVPTAVLGGAGIALFGMVAASGVRSLSKVHFNNSNVLVVAISVGVALLPTVAPGIYEEFPDWFQLIFDSGISAGAICAILLNLLLNGEQMRAERAGDAQLSSHDAVRGPAAAVLTHPDATGTGLIATVRLPRGEAERVTETVVEPVDADDEPAPER